MKKSQKWVGGKAEKKQQVEKGETEVGENVKQKFLINHRKEKVGGHGGR